MRKQVRPIDLWVHEQVGDDAESVWVGVPHGTAVTLLPEEEAAFGLVWQQQHFVRPVSAAWCPEARAFVVLLRHGERFYTIRAMGEEEFRSSARAVLRAAASVPNLLTLFGTTEGA